MKLILSLTLTLFLSLALNAQVKAVQDFVEDHPELEKYFVYQSTLRLLNQSGNEDFNMLIRHIRKINAYVSSSGSEEVTLKDYDKMISNLEKDNFEILIRAKYSGAHVSMMGQDKGGDSQYVLAVRAENDFALLEMDGELDLKYMKAIQDIDFSKLDDILGENASEEGNEDH
jgi:hypothetical protein